MKSIHLLARVVATLSLALCLLNLVLIAYQRQILNRLAYQERHGIYDDDPQLERLPGHFEDVSMVITVNNKFSLIDDKAWASTLPGKRGFVRLGQKGRSFAISQYHQLHCVNALRFSYTVARDGLVKDPEVLKAKIFHDNHCFQFIRQSIFCRADASLVPVSGNNQTLAHVGFGVAHRCRNWTQVRQFVLEADVKWEGIPYLGEGSTIKE